MKVLISSLTLIFATFLCGNTYMYAQDIPRDPNLLTGKLTNGLTYFIRHNNIPRGQADFHLVQKVGSILEEESQRGLAHFLEHMAFNGTMHFPGNTMVEELEKKGIKFGTNINAYTSYDETVYRLTNIPLNREGILDTALMVLHDWSGFILNNDRDIDEERGVIREEWRTRSSGYLRVQENDILPILFAGTPYANRLPIGTMEIINNFKYQELRNYYKKWYRPDLQAIVVVGDVDPDQVLNKLKRLFADIPYPLNPTVRNYYSIPVCQEPIVAIASDSEIRNTSASVYWKQENDLGGAKSKYQYFKVGLINGIISNMMNQRFSDLMKKTNTTYQVTARMATYSVASSTPAWTLNVNAPDNNLLYALRIALEECERLSRFGFGRNEFEPTIKKFNLTLNESDYYDRMNRPNFMYGKDYIDQFLYDRISPTSDWKYTVTKEILDSISIDTLNFYVKKYTQHNNVAFEILCPKKQGLKLPSKSDILGLWGEVQREILKPWIKEQKQSDLANLEPPMKGKVINIVHDTRPFGYTKWTLSNGVNVWFKKTNYQESDLFISGFKAGGYSRVDIKRLPSALAYTELSQMTNGFEGVDGRATVSSFLNRNDELIAAKGTIMDPEVLFQNVFLKMNIFKMETQVFNNWKTRKQEELNSRSVNPKVDYIDTLKAIMSNHHPRAMSLTDRKVLDQVTYDKVVKLHEEFFGNANDFTFIITGNLQIDSVKVLSEIWLGGLKSFKTKEIILDHDLLLPRGFIKKHFLRRMETPQSTVTVGYTGELPYNIKNNILMTFCSEILQMIYTETIREKEGGSYGVRVDSELLRYPKEQFIFQVNFDTDPKPAKKDKLMSIVYEEINNMWKNGPDQKKVDNIKQNLLKDYMEDIGKENARYWDGMAGKLLSSGIDWRSHYEKIIRSVTSKMIKEFSRNIFNQGNVIEVVMNPK